MARPNIRRSTLLHGGAGLAMAAALVLPAPAQADAFNGTPVFVRGTGNVDRTVNNVDTITISSSTAVIDWTVFEDNFGNALTFLPDGRTAFFQDAPGQGGFAVLNRILPSTNGNVVVFQGSVISRLQDATGNFSNGGTVAFYSPTGILIGGNAVFDVGQLLLTTLDPDLDSFERYAAGGVLQLTGSSGQTAGVTIGAGAQITAPGDGSYFAVAAPQIVMRGSAYINGSVAYVAGEQVSMTYNNGLFDIQVPVGTSVRNPINHRGSTGGPSSTGTGDNHVIYVVGRAAANPITMLLRGNLGFDTAVTAGVDNGDIILSAGYDVAGRSVLPGAVAGNAPAQSISISGAANFVSSVGAYAAGSFSANSNGGTIAFDDGLTVDAAREISILARNANDITIAGDAFLNSEGTISASDNVTGGTIELLARDGASLAITGNLSARATPAGRTGIVTGGFVELSANGGSVTVGGDVLLSAKVNRFFGNLVQGNSFGGTARLFAQNGGLIDLGGELRLESEAFGFGDAGRNATGGTSEIVAQSGGDIAVAGNTVLTSWAIGGNGQGVLGNFDGGRATGGLARILSNQGTISFGGDLNLSANGNGGVGAGFFTPGNDDSGGIGEGGQALVNAIDGSITVAGLASVQAEGFGGQGSNGGTGTGGVAQIFADGTGSIAMTDASLLASAFGGNALGSLGLGGDANGGRSIILTEGTGDIALSGTANVRAQATGGSGQSGGDAVGGNAGIYSVFGSIAIDGFATVSAFATAGSATIGFGGDGGDAQGGTAYIQADGSQSASASLIIGGNVTIDAGGRGGNGGAGDGSEIAAGTGGNGVAGTFQGAPGTGGAFAIAGRDNALLSIGGSTVVRADGYGGTGGTGGAGQSGGAGGAGIGGTSQAGTFSGRGDGSLGEGLARYSNLFLYSQGTGGSGGSGAAGQGAGGVGLGNFAGVFATGAAVEAGIINSFVTGQGGSGSVGGDGYGGQTGIGISGGSLTAEGLFASAQGFGGNGTTGNGGNGVGGEASIDSDGTLNVSGDTSYEASGYGGASDFADGGLGQGGVARLTTTQSGAADLLGFTSLTSMGWGGAGANGGAGRSGSAMMEVLGNSAVGTADVRLRADARGGTGSVRAGDAVAGDARLLVRDGSFTATGLFNALADAVGGDGLDGVDGGAAFGGIAGVDIRRGSATFDGGFSALAGGFGGSAIGIGGNGGAGYGGAAVFIVDGSAQALGTASVQGGLSLLSDGYGGQGGQGSASVAAGAGGLGQGGRADVASLIDDGQGTGAYLLVNADYGQLTVADSANLTAIGSGGSGGAAQAGTTAGRGGDGIGGDAVAGLIGPASGGPRLGFADFGSLGVTSTASGGDGGFDADGNQSGTGGDAEGGSSMVVSRGALLTAGTISISDIASGGSGSAGGNASGGEASMATSSEGRIEVGNVSVFAQAFGGFGISGDGGSGQGGRAYIAFQDGATTVTGTTEVNAWGYGGGSVDGQGGDGIGGVASIGAENSIAGTGTFAGGVNVGADGFGGLSETGSAGLGVGGYAYARTQAGSSLEITSLQLSANGFIVFVDGEPVGPSTGGLVQLLASGGSTIAVDQLGMSAGGVSTGGSFDIIANNADISIGNVTIGTSGFDPVAGAISSLRANNGTIAISDFAALSLSGDLQIVTSNGGLIGGPSLAAPTASISIRTPGKVTIDGDNDNAISFGGRELSIAASDLDILSGARIGAAILNLTVLSNDSITVLGGTVDEAGFTLTQAELERIEAGSASFASSSDGSASDDILFRNAVISGSLDDGVSSVAIRAGGIARVEGILAYLDAAATDALSISAQRLEIVTPGAIIMAGPDGNPTGSFSFFGRDFWMADAETMVRLRDDVAFAGRNEVLATAADGSADPLGYLRAGSVALTLGKSLLVRNSGTTEAPGGITVTGDLRISSNYFETAPDGSLVLFEDPIDVFAYGRRLNADGTFTVGEAFFALIDFTNSTDGELVVSAYVEGSQFNNCDINTSECAAVVPPEPPVPPQPPEPPAPTEREVVLEEVALEAPQTSTIIAPPVTPAPINRSEQETNVEFGADFPGLLNAALISEETSIDDPVASGGDIALYGSGDPEVDEDDNEENGDDR